MNNKKVIESIWFTPFMSFFTIGIIVCENENGDRKALIGWGAGLNQPQDENRIIENGAKLPIDILQSVIDLLKPRDDKKRKRITIKAYELGKTDKLVGIRLKGQTEDEVDLIDVLEVEKDAESGSVFVTTGRGGNYQFPWEAEIGVARLTESK